MVFELRPRSRKLRRQNWDLFSSSTPKEKALEKCLRPSVSKEILDFSYLIPRNLFCLYSVSQWRSQIYRFEKVQNLISDKLAVSLSNKHLTSSIVFLPNLAPSTVPQVTCIKISWPKNIKISSEEKASCRLYWKSPKDCNKNSQLTTGTYIMYRYCTYVRNNKYCTNVYEDFPAAAVLNKLYIAGLLSLRPNTF